MRRVLMGLLIVATLVGCTAQPTQTTTVTTQPATYHGGEDALRAMRFRPAGAGPFPAVVVVHGDFGVTEPVRNHARRLAERGLLALVVDLYRGEVIKDLMDAHVMDRGLPEERVRGDLRAAVDFLSELNDVRPEAIGVLGFDSGGGNALDAALHDDRIRAVVTCYGRLTTDAAALAPLRASVLGVFAGKDEGITADTLARFRKAMEKAEKKVAGIHVYEACNHGFLNPMPGQKLSDAERAAADEAWEKVESYLTSELEK